jgi:hypothetical protein
MTAFVPRGYISVREALDRLGRELFASEWTGDEYKARRGLISKGEWLKIKDLAPARGGGASGRLPVRKSTAGSAATAPHPTGDPSSSSFQTEYRARMRYVDIRDRLRVMLESGDLIAAILDPFTGILHRASTTLWRRFGADLMIEKGQAPIPGSPNPGTLIVKEFRMPSRPSRRIPQAKFGEVIDALREKVATESLTRAQQKDFVRKRFPSYRVTERQFGKIFQKIPVSIGRPKKFDKGI